MALNPFQMPTVAPDLILASTSHYRRTLLERLGIAFRCVAPRIDEDAAKAETAEPAALAERLACAKAEAVAARFPRSVVIGCDQVAAIDGEPLGKPGTTERAADQLSRLAGRTHELLTAVCVLRGDERRSHLDRTRLTMRPLSRAALSRYVTLDDPTDCAGSYKIEAAGVALFERIETADFTAITGLPLIAVVAILKEFGIDVP